jgi:hypothetical protein
MLNESLKKDLQVLAEAQLAFELNNWSNIGSVMRDRSSESTAWGTLFEKDGKSFYLNIISAPKALLFLRRAV